MEFEEVNKFLIQERLKNDSNYEDDINYGSSDDWDYNKIDKPTYQYFSLNNNDPSFIKEKKKKKKRKEKSISNRFIHGVQKLKNKLEGLSMSSSDESIYSVSDEYDSTFSHLFINDNKNIHSPILSPIPNQYRDQIKEMYDDHSSYFTIKNNNIVSPIPLKKTNHESLSPIHSSTTTSSSSPSNYKSYYSKRAKTKRHLGFFWRNNHHLHHKSLKSNNKLLNIISSNPSLKIQHDHSNLTHISHDHSLKLFQEKQDLMILNRTSNELLNQISNSIQRFQCMIDIEIQSVEDYQKDIIFYTNQLEQLDHDIDYLKHKINIMTKESNNNIIIEDMNDWQTSLLQSQQNHHIILNRFESYYIRFILSKNPLKSLKLKIDITLKNFHQINLISYWCLLIALFLLLCIFIYWFIYYATTSLFIMCLLLSIMIIYWFP